MRNTSLKCSGTTRVNDGSHSFTCHPHVYQQEETKYKCIKNLTSLITFCVSRRRRKMYCGHARLCVCLSVRGRTPTLLYCTNRDVTWGRGRGCPLVVHYWEDLQSGHGLRCYGNITRTLVTSLRPFCDMTTVRTAGWAGSARAAGR